MLVISALFHDSFYSHSVHILCSLTCHMCHCIGVSILYFYVTHYYFSNLSPLILKHKRIHQELHSCIKTCTDFCGNLLSSEYYLHPQGYSWASIMGSCLFHNILMHFWKVLALSYWGLSFHLYNLQWYKLANMQGSIHGSDSKGQYSLLKCNQYPRKSGQYKYYWCTYNTL